MACLGAGGLLMGEEWGRSPVPNIRLGKPVTLLWFGVIATFAQTMF